MCTEIRELDPVAYKHNLNLIWVWTSDLMSLSLTFSITIIIQFWSRFIPVNEGGRIYPTLTAICPTPTLHLARFMASFFSKPELLLSFSTCVFHVFFGPPRFLLPYTLNCNTFLKTCPSSLLNTCPYHLTPFAFAIWTTVSFNPNISIETALMILHDNNRNLL